MATLLDQGLWPRDNMALSPFHAGVDAFVQQRLPPSPPKRPQGKSVADPLLGYIHLSALEMSLVDTELFQRLRRITQVGLASLIYPTLGYARFEHSLGAVGMLQKVVDRLRQVHSHRTARRPEIVEMLNQNESALRLAVLFHDVGHCLFSHVSERVMRILPGNSAAEEGPIQTRFAAIIGNIPTSEPIYPSMRTLESEYKRKFKKALAPAEILSIAIITSPHIRAWVERVMLSTQFSRTEYGAGAETPTAEAGEIVRKAAFLIAGAPIDSSHLFLSQLVSSALDVDKLDYMQRDAHYSGIPIGIDLVRLLDKMRVFPLSSGELPNDLRYMKKFLTPPFNVLGVSHGGQFAFEEFCLARASLYDKIYLHQKVRNVEAHLSALLSRLPEELPAYNNLHQWLYLSESVIAHDDLPIPNSRRIGDLFATEASAFLRCDGFRKRELLERAFAMGIRNALSESIQDEPSESPTVLAIQEIGLSARMFLRKLRSEAVKLANIAGEQLNPGVLDDLILDIPDHRRVSQKIQSIHVKQPALLPFRWALPIDKVTEYYKTRALAYVYAQRPVCALIALASEKLLFEEQSLLFEQREFLSAEVVKEIELLKERVAASQYYEDVPVLKPKSQYLTSASGEEAVGEIVSNLVEFHSPQGQRVTPASITQFVMQFPPDLHEGLLTLLTKVEVIRPVDVINEVFLQVKMHPIEGQLIAPIGNLRDSANHLSYYFKNRPEVEMQAIKTDWVSDASVLRAERIVLFDDNFNSSKQTVNIFAQWLGVPLPEELRLDEPHVDPLSDAAKERLRALPIALVYGVAPEGGKAQLIEHLSEHIKLPKTNLSVHVYKELLKRQRPFSGDRSLIPDGSALKEVLIKIGTDLLTPTYGESAAARALGYAGTEGLVVFPYNVPTMTISALWCTGIYQGRPWYPILGRRRSHGGGLIPSGATGKTKTMI